MLVINSPHNPTSAAFDQSQLDAVSELLMKLPQAEPPVLFSDEMQFDRSIELQALGLKVSGF